jgi:cysteine desulfurase
MNQRIYLDNNASTPLDPQVVQYLQQILPQLTGNPSSTHHFGQAVRSLITKARTSIAARLKIKPNELIFTSGGTESINTAIRGLVAGKQPGHIITSMAEHSCVIAACKYLETQGYEVSYLPVGAWGAVLPEAVEASIRPNTQLVALMAVNNETGVKTDIHSIARITQQRNIPFFVDGVALMGKEEVIIHPGISAMAFSGHKFHALHGTGFLYLRAGMKCQPLVIGGEQEHGRRAGTENVFGILSMAKAIELISEQSIDHMRTLRDAFENELLQVMHGKVLVNGAGPRVANVSNLAFLGVDGETLLINLDRAGIAASHGSACHSGSLEPSRVLVSMGLPMEQVNGSIRFSFSRLTTTEEVAEAIKIIKDVLGLQRVTDKHDRKRQDQA